MCFSALFIHIGYANDAAAASAIVVGSFFLCVRTQLIFAAERKRELLPLLFQSFERITKRSNEHIFNLIEIHKHETEAILFGIFVAFFRNEQANL